MLESEPMRWISEWCELVNGTKVQSFNWSYWLTGTAFHSCTSSGLHNWTGCSQLCQRRVVPLDTLLSSLFFEGYPPNSSFFLGKLIQLSLLPSILIAQHDQLSSQIVGFLFWGVVDCCSSPIELHWEIEVHFFPKMHFIGFLAVS